MAGLTRNGCVMMLLMPAPLPAVALSWVSGDPARMSCLDHDTPLLPAVLLAASRMVPGFTPLH